MADKRLFTATVTMLAEYFGKPLTEAVMGAYWLGLGELTDDQIKGAVARSIRECKFMPTAAELLSFSGHKPRDVAGEAVVAWGIVRRALDALDVYGNPDFGLVVNATVRNIGGWLYLCEAKLADLEWRRKDFERAYKVLAERDPIHLDGAPLVGEWKNAPIQRVSMPGLPAAVARPVLAEVETPEAAQAKELIRELANGKGLTHE